MSEIEYPLSIRFKGPGLKTDGMPIGELGEAMIAIQRLVYKAYLIHDKREFIHTSLNEAERQRFALQIAERKHGSEFLSFTWLKDTFGNPEVQKMIREMFTVLGIAAFGYMRQEITGILEGLNTGKDKFKNKDVDELAARMYPEIQEIVKHISNPMPVKTQKGSKKKPKKVMRVTPPRVTTIEIKIAGVRRKIVFNEKVKKYVKSIENTTRYGDVKTIRGKVDKAHVLNKDCIETLIGRDRFWVKMCLKEKRRWGRNDRMTLFEQLMTYLADPKIPNEFYFTGRPIFRIGRSFNTFSEFEVEEIQPVY